jgi:tetratricopeptide (TPR) repeat protein
LRLQPDNLKTHWNLTINCNETRDKEGTVREAERALTLTEKRKRLFPDDETARVWYAVMLFCAGKHDELRSALAAMEDVKDSVSFFNNAICYAKLGEHEKALSLIRRSVEQGFANVSLIETWRDDELKDHPELLPELEAIIALAKSEPGLR